MVSVSRVGRIPRRKSLLLTTGANEIHDRIRSARMSTDYSALLLEYPAVISKDQLYRICHISKRKATWLLENGIIPCRDSGKKTRRFQIYTADVVNYLITLENEPQKVAIPVGIFTCNKYRKKQENPVAHLPRSELKKHLCLKWCSEPDALSLLCC